MHLVEEDPRVDEGRRHDDRQDEIEKRVAQHLAARPLAGQAGGAVGVAFALYHRRVARRVAAQQEEDEGREGEGEHGGVDRPDRLPGDQPDEGDRQDGKERLAAGVAQRGDGQRPPAAALEIAGHGGRRDMAHHPLAEEAQGQDGEEQRGDVPGRQQRHVEAGAGEEQDDGQRKARELDAVDELAGLNHDRGARHRRQRIDRAEAAVAEGEHLAQLGGEERDEEGLAVRGEKGEQEAEGEQAPVGQDEAEIGQRRAKPAQGE